MSQSAPSNIVQMARLRRLAQENIRQSPKPKVLFVDDEERILNSLRALFRMQYDVTVSTDGYHAVELLKREHFHLLVSDQRMPTMPGVELLRRSRELSPNTVRILLTGFSDLAAIVGSVNDGEVYRYVNKPWDSEELKDIIASAIRVGQDLERLSPLSSAKPAAANSDDHPIEEIPAVSPKKAPAAMEQSAGVPPPTLPPPASDKQHIEPVMVSQDMDFSVLFLDMEGHLLACYQECGLEGCHALTARNAEEALQLMSVYEVGVIVASIDGVDRDNVSFLCLLKKEHPHVVALAVARLGDSETIISLVNAARIFRVIFHPLRPKVLQHHLEAALKQVGDYRVQPELLKVQQASEEPASANLVSGLGSLLKSRMASIRSFFRKR